MTLFYLFCAAMLVFLGWEVWRTWDYHRKLKAYSRASDEESQAISRLSIDGHSDEAVKRFIEFCQRRPPEPP